MLPFGGLVEHPKLNNETLEHAGLRMPEIPFPKEINFKTFPRGMPRVPLLWIPVSAPEYDSGTDAWLLGRAEFPKTVFYF